MTLDEFINQYDQIGIDFDGRYGQQCMDLFHYYEMEVWNVDRLKVLRASSAYNAFKKGHKDYKKFIYKKGMVPEPGDVIFWDDTLGPYGHVAIFITGGEHSFISFDQNYPIGSKSHQQQHNYKSVAGWLRFNELTKEEMKKLDDYIKQTDKRLDAIENIEGETKIVKQIKKLMRLKYGKTKLNAWLRKKSKKRK